MSFIQYDSGVRSTIPGNIYQPQEVQGTDANGPSKKTPISMPVDELFNRCDYIISLPAERRSQFKNYAEAIMADDNKNGIVYKTSELFNNVIEGISGTSTAQKYFTPEYLESALMVLPYEYIELLTRIANGFAPDFWQSQYDKLSSISNIGDNAWGAYNFQIIQAQSKPQDEIKA